ncbi:MAG: CoA transferase [Acidimicrobiia bacterium]
MSDPHAPAPGPILGELRVVDATWGLAGRFAGRLLADYGARVTVVRRDAGPGPTPLTDRLLERGCAVVEADLRTEPGRRRLDELLADADVLLVALDRRGDAPVDLDALERAHPRLVVAVLSGYGATPWAGRPGYEALVAARLGITSEQTGHRPGPKFLGQRSIAYGAGYLAAIGTLSALRARQLTGCGQRLDASLLDSVLAQSPMNWWWNEKGSTYLGAADGGPRFGRNRLVADPFECGCGEYLVLHTAGGDGGFKRLMDLVGLGDRIREVTGQRESSVPLDDDELAVVTGELPKAFLARSRDEWIPLLEAADLAVLPVLRPGEVLADAQVRAAGVVATHDDPELGPVEVVGPVVKVRAEAPAAEPGAERDEPGTVGRRDGSGGEGPLAGVRILDFSAYFATAYGAKLLSDLGADVIKVEPLVGDQMRPLPDPFEASNRGKRSLAIDLKHPSAEALMHRLVASVDVVVHNLRPGKAERLGLGWDQLSAVNPRLVYCYQPGFGSAGPRSGTKSFAPLLSGFAGLFYRGTGQGEPPVRRVIGNEDYYGGLLGAFASLVGLESVRRTGRGVLLEAPQLHSILSVTADVGVDGAGVAHHEHRLQPGQVGVDAYYRLYPTGDGWICVACAGERQRRGLRDALGVAVPDGDDDAVAAAVAEALSTLTAVEASARLDAAGVPCEVPHPSPYIPELLWEEWALESGLVYEHHHPQHGWIREIGNVFHLSGTPAVRRPAASLLGEHSEEILREVGISAEQIARAERDGVVGTTAPSRAATGTTTS